MIDYSLINHAIFYYKELGYKEIETPWLVDEEISNLTKPIEKINFHIYNSVLVGSGEQSFLQLLYNGELDQNVPSRYITTTSCFRDDTIDDTHKRYFVKSEIIIFGFSELELLDELNKLKKHAYDFFSSFTTVKILEESANTYDIIDCDTGIELGSYGLRRILFPDKSSMFYVYGTACAEPRLSFCLKQKKKGYHDNLIPKAQVGTFLKIVEEFEEAKDAHLNNNLIMELVELSDLYGAIECYLEKQGITMEMLATMSNTTKRAFLNGRRQ